VADIVEPHFSVPRADDPLHRDKSKFTAGRGKMAASFSKNSMGSKGK
jgi:hypothetical protein